MARPTIADVARIAEVSKSTVSRVLRGETEYIRDETRARVLRTVAELQFRPSSVARSLVSKRTRTVGLLISDVGNPFYSEVIHGVEDVALGHFYAVYFCNTSYQLDRGLTYINGLIDKQVDGVLIMSSSMSDDLVLELVRHQVPTVVLDWGMPVASEFLGCLSVDFEPGIRAAVDRLVDLGHRRFAHVSGPLGLPTSHLRRDAFLASLAARGCDPAQVAVVEGNLRIDSGQQALTALLALPEPPTAVFAANDLMAFGLLFAARRAGLHVPSDLSIIGLDDIQLAAEIDPPLSTVALPRYEIGSIAMSMILELIDRSEPGASSLTRRVQTRFIERQSTGRVAAG